MANCRLDVYMHGRKFNIFVGLSNVAGCSFCFVVTMRHGKQIQKQMQKIKQMTGQ